MYITAITAILLSLAKAYYLRLGPDVPNRCILVNTISVTYIYKCDNNMEHVLNSDVWNISLHYNTQPNKSVP